MPNDTIKGALATPVCPHCGTAISKMQVIQPGHCGARTCLEHHAVQGARKRREEKARRYEEGLINARTMAADMLATGAQRLGTRPEAFQIATVPHLDTALVPLPEGRRDAFKAYLVAIIAEATETLDTEMDMPHGTPERPRLPDVLLTAACTACQGVCCVKGGGAAPAFLTARHMRDLIRRRPDVSPDGIAGHYLASLPEVSIDGSCVYHGAQGCTQDRDWRANICNSFHCEDMFTMARRLTPDSPIALVGVTANVAGGNVPKKIVAFDPATGTITVSQDD